MTDSQKVKVHEIAAAMAKSGLSNSFVAKAASLAMVYEGALGLMILWSKEEDKKGRDEIVADLQEEIDAHTEIAFDWSAWLENL